jgi:hypothetical protein
MVSALAALAMVSLAAAWVEGAYRGRPINWLLSWMAEDRWCPSPGDGVGVHCFGDYFTVADQLRQGELWTDGPYPFGVSNYLPAGTIPFAPFTEVWNLTGSARLSLILYLLALAIAMAAPALWAARAHRGWALPIVLLLCAMTTPFMGTLDRGNSIGFVVPAVLGTWVAVIRGNQGHAVIWMAVATTIKPQFALLALVFIAQRQWRRLLQVGALSLAAQVVGTVLMSPQPLADLRAALGSAAAYSEGGAVPAIGHGNFSVGKSLADLLRLAGQAPASDWVLGHAAGVTAVVLVVALAVSVFLGKHIRVEYVLLGATTLACYVLPLNFYYYAVPLLVPLAMFLRDPISPVARPGRGAWDRLSPPPRGGGGAGPLMDRLTVATIWAALAATAVQIPIDGASLGIVAWASPSSISRLVVVPLWSVVLLMILTGGVVGRLSRGPRPGAAGSAPDENRTRPAPVSATGTTDHAMGSPSSTALGGDAPGRGAPHV